MSDDYNFNVKRRRPEEIYDNIRDYYSEEEISRYSMSKSIMRIQRKITLRALELLELTRSNLLILDAGCGPGFSTSVIRKQGHYTIALDFIAQFLYFYDIKDLNPIVADICKFPFKKNIFDAIISISAFQWIIRNIHKDDNRKRIIDLMRAFYFLLKPKAKMMIQFYPKNRLIIDALGVLITENTKFKGNYIIDNPNNPRKRKIFLLLEK
ncbi:MAG: methyltransferase domain-containing protein [Promethearchaeota archaeon]